MNRFQKIFLSLIIVSILLSIIIFFLQSDDNDSIVLKIKNATSWTFQLREKYGKNKEFLINNNLAQYSAYLIVDKDIKHDRRFYRIEVFVQFNKKYVTEKGKLRNDDFKCVVKLLGHNETVNDQIVEIEVFESPVFYWDENKKLIFKLNPMHFKSYNDDPLSFDLNNILVGVILKKDFNKNLNVDRFLLEEFETPIVLPYSLIKFQIPTIIESQIPRITSVSLCAHYIHAKPPQLLNWFNIHLSMGIREIIVYDAMPDKMITKIVNETFGNDDRIRVIPFNIDYEDLCNVNVLFKQFTGIDFPDITKENLIESCKHFFTLEFNLRYVWRNKHEQLTSNDCFTVLSQKYEFIGYYDLDEFIFPRSMDSMKDFYVHKSNNLSVLCSLNPFINNRYATKSTIDQHSIYDYLMYLIKKHKKRRNIDKLAYIYFNHVAFLLPLTLAEKQFIFDINTLNEKIDNGTDFKFPLNLFLSDPPRLNGRTFEIFRNDIQYVRDLNKALKSINPDVCENYLIKTKNIDRTLSRYLYYITEGNERMGKSIHYYKNVKTLFVHYAQEISKTSWSFEPSESDGHFLSHFRHDVSDMYNKNFKGSIRQLNVDFEYLTFLLKNFTNFCNFTQNLK
jgi:hypothetical protein